MEAWLEHAACKLNAVDQVVFETICESPSATLTKLKEVMHLKESRKTKNPSGLVSKTSSGGTGKNASALMHELSKTGKKKMKQGPYCEPGKDNPASTSHNANHHYQLHPELRPPHFLKPIKKATTQLVEVENSVERKTVSVVSFLILNNEHSLVTALCKLQPGKRL
ncbi:uncharacterized protein VP01_1120g1 [Puccinia sorghi]|uniref:Uncharacterized protein n=1 Tax=Puccinia sorghi TaxID=27349 RepID=A0A0L6VSD0_9BASI|nr:uncharacterized protein VP01_1120g1 [Puccinia sorghi]